MFKYSENHGSKESAKSRHVYMVGAFPPPVHGMAVVNAAVREQLMLYDIDLTVINVAAKNLDRSVVARFGRLPSILRGLYHMMSSGELQNSTLYMSVSGGFGQFYEILFLLIARRNRMRVYIHYHSFAYLNKKSLLTQTLTAVAGKSCTHITLSSNMASRLQELYPSANRILSISNAVFFIDEGSVSYFERSSLKTIGFISNISEEKGIFDFLDLVDACESADISVHAIIAGPYQDEDTELKVRARLAELHAAEYIGPQYGKDKKSFYDSIDVLVFPTRYANEAEPLTIHEAMQHAIPVIAYGRGSIPEIVNSECGLVIESDSPFCNTALQQIMHWLDSPEKYSAASRSAVENFNTASSRNMRSWQQLINEISGAENIDIKPGKVLDNFNLEHNS